VAGGWCWFVLREKYCWLVAGGWFVLREKYCWLVADKPSEHAGEAELCKLTRGSRSSSDRKGICFPSVLEAQAVSVLTNVLK
jgi:hypothetical protein